jgi:putative lipoic acid-binding regulatory protein
MADKRYEEQRVRLAGLPPARRFEELLDFPCQHLFKVIGAPENLARDLRSLLEQREHPDAVLVERPSSKGRWLAVSFEIRVQSGEELADIYEALEQVPGVTHLF